MNYGFPQTRRCHKKEKFVAIDENRRILFIARVLHNRQVTEGKVYFDNGRIFNVPSETVGKRKVSLFPYTEEWGRRWLQQCKIDRIGNFLETAKTEEVFIVADFVAEESGREKSKKDPFWLTSRNEKS